MNKKILIAGLIISVMLLVPINSAYSNISIQIDNKPIIPTSRGNIFYVGGNGSGNYSKIQDAIYNASDGDTVFVFDESSPYYEYVTITKSINLIGENRNTTIIDGMHTFYVIGVEADWVNISGLTVQNSNDAHRGIAIGGCDYTTITDNNILNNGIGIGTLYSDYTKIISNNVMNNRDGIWLDLSINSIITNNNISSNYDYGITLSGTIQNIITGNDISNNYKYGMWLRRATSNNTITGNSFFNDNLYINESFQNTISNNTVNGKPLIYLEDESDTVIDVDVGQIILVNCDNITIQNQKISQIGVGIELWNSNNCLISNNEILSNNWYGIHLKSSSGNIIVGNNLSNNNYGIYLTESSNDNLVYHNNFLNNKQNALDKCYNTWDDGKYGNYWSDFKDRYPYAVPRFLKPWMWNTPYEIPGDGNNNDTCPLVEQWSKSKSKDIQNNRASSGSPLLRFLERYPLLNLLLQRGD